MLKTYTSLEDGRALVRVPELAERLHTSVATVERALKHLVSLGLIERDRPSKDTVDKRQTEYTFKEKVSVRDKDSQEEVGELHLGDYLPQSTGKQLEAVRKRLKRQQGLPPTIVLKVYNVNIQTGNNNTNITVIPSQMDELGTTISREEMLKIKRHLEEKNIDLPLDDTSL
jgi:DNA-binding transcriptional regulator YhcF (GntR family)